MVVLMLTDTCMAKTHVKVRAGCGYKLHVRFVRGGYVRPDMGDRPLLYRLGGWHPARERQRDGLRGARCTHRAGVGRRASELIGDGGDESALSPGGGVGGGEEGEGTGHDHRRAGERAEGGRSTLAKSAASGVPVPRAARRLEVGF